MTTTMELNAQLLRKARLLEAARQFKGMVDEWQATGLPNAAWDGTEADAAVQVEVRDCFREVLRFLGYWMTVEAIPNWRTPEGQPVTSASETASV